MEWETVRCNDCNTTLRTNITIYYQPDGGTVNLCPRCNRRRCREGPEQGKPAVRENMRTLIAALEGR